MIEIPVEDLMKKTASIFKLVNLAARRTSQLNQGRKPKLEIMKNEKTSSIALREIALGKINFITED